MRRRAAAATILLALIGLTVSGVIASVHRKLAESSGYTSFCNVNESVNCDVVLSSSYAYFVGVPVAWWAVLAYLLFALGALVAMQAPRLTRRQQAATAVFGAAVWSVLYSLFLAGVALILLRTVCVLCGGLYLVNAGLLVSTWMLLGAVRAEGRGSARGADKGQGRTRLIVGGAALAVVVFVALAGWEASGGDENLSAEEVARRYPDFYHWYMTLPVVSVDPTGRHTKGDEGSVVIVEFSDFECGHCAEAYRSLRRVLPRFGSDVRLVFRHFPLNGSCNPAVSGPLHGYACLAAMASECAAAQGRFWHYHDLLFENQRALDRDSLIAYAEQIRLDRAEFVRCLESDAPRRAVERDVSEGDRLRVVSTPTFFLNGRTLAGALDREKLEHAIRLERAARLSDN